MSDMLQKLAKDYRVKTAAAGTSAVPLFSTSRVIESTEVARPTVTTTTTTPASSIVLEDVDLVQLILLCVDTGLTPRVFARWRLVSSAWRTACGLDERLLMRAARTPSFLSKKTFSGLFGLTSDEADSFEREVFNCKHGIIYKYKEGSINDVITALSGFKWWSVRIAMRAKERQAWESRKRARLY